MLTVIESLKDKTPKATVGEIFWYFLGKKHIYVRADDVFFKSNENHFLPDIALDLLDGYCYATAGGIYYHTKQEAENALARVIDHLIEEASHYCVVCHEYYATPNSCLLCQKPLCGFCDSVYFELCPVCYPLQDYKCNISDRIDSIITNNLDVWKSLAKH